MASTSQTLDEAPERSSSAYGWYVVAVLVIAYTMSYIDRQILTLLVQPIKATLGISDVQVSLLHGMAFALFYTVLGLPIARLADRYNRVKVVSVGVALWSIMTAACGFARGFGQLFAARVGVGVGEAALGPAAYSIITDSFPARTLAKALSAYTGAIYLGAGIAMIAGGALIGMVPGMELPLVGHAEPWQVIFVIVGLPGLLVALLTSSLREPARTGSGAHGAQFPSLGAVCRHVLDRRGAYLFAIFGFAASSLMWNGVSGWIPTHFVRTFGWTPAQVGLRYGGLLLILGSGGIYSGSVISDWMSARGRLDANLRLGMISALGSIPTGAIAPLMHTATGSLAVYGLFIFFASMPYGCAAAALQEITPNPMRAQVTAFYFFWLNMAGIGLGPTVVALFTDKLFGNEQMLRYSLSLTVLVGGPLCVVLLGLALRPYRAALSAARAG